MHRAACGDPASTPWASNRSPNRATCQGRSYWLIVSRASSQVGSTSPVAGSTYPPTWSSQTGSSSPSRYLTGTSGHHTWWYVAASTRRSSDRAMVPRRATWTCGASLRWGSTAAKYCNVMAEVAAQVLDEPVEQRRERQRVPGGLLIVVGGRVDRHAAVVDPAVGRAGQRDEHRRAERLAVRRGVGLPERARTDLALRQVRGVLAAAGRPVPPGRLVGGDVPADAGLGDLLVELADELVEVKAAPLRGAADAELRLRRHARRTPSRSCESPPDQHSSPATQTRCVLLDPLPWPGPLTAA